jgi:uncharacterized membrane protein
MDNNQVISFIKGKINDGTVTKEQVIGAVNEVTSAYSGASYVPSSVNNNSDLPHKTNKININLNLTNILYIIGSLIAIVGIGIFVAQNWDAISFAVKMTLTLGISVITFGSGLIIKDKEVKNLSKVLFAISGVSLFGAIVLAGTNWNLISSPVRILITLGLAILTYILGFVFKGIQYRSVSQVMFVISACIFPLGSYVFIYENNINLDWTVNIAISLTGSLLYLIAYLLTKRNTLFLATIGYFSWSYIVAFSKILEMYNQDATIYKWAMIVLGLSYILISHSINTDKVVDKTDLNEKNKIRNILYFAGTMLVLGTSYSFDSFDILYIGLLFAVFYASIFLRSTVMLVVTSGFLIAEIVRLTSKYFVNSIGWPLSLIVIGFLVIGIGYVTFSLNKKYISNNAKVIS